MSWVLLSLLAPAVLTAVIFVDKYVLTHRVKDSRAMPLYTACTAIVAGTAVWLLSGQPDPGLRNGVLILAAGLASLFGYVLYFYALAQNQTSYIVAMLQLAPLFTLLLSVVTLRTWPGPWQLTGFMTVLMAALGLSIDDEEKKLRLDRAFYAVLGADILFAISDIIIKFTIGRNGFTPIFVYESWGVALGGIALFLFSRSMRRAFLASIAITTRSTFGLLFLNEGLFIASRAITFLAISLGPVALVVVLGGTQVFYGLLFGLIATRMFPVLFHENTDKITILRKVGFAVALFIGIGMISLS